MHLQYVARRVARRERYTEFQPQVVEVPYEYKVTSWKPERRVRVVTHHTAKVPYKYETVEWRSVKRTRNVRVTRYVDEQRTRNVRVTEYVPQEKSRQVRVTEYREVPVKRSETYTVIEPQTIEREIDVPTTRMVERKVREKSPMTWAYTPFPGLRTAWGAPGSMFAVASRSGYNYTPFTFGSPMFR